MARCSICDTTLNPATTFTFQGAPYCRTHFEACQRQVAAHPPEPASLSGQLHQAAGIIRGFGWAALIGSWFAAFQALMSGPGGLVDAGFLMLGGLATLSLFSAVAMIATGVGALLSPRPEPVAEPATAAGSSVRHPA